MMTTNDSGDAMASVVRPYAMTSGRTRSEVDVPVEATVVVTAAGQQQSWTMSDPNARIIRACGDRRSVAEIAVKAQLALGVTRVLIGDLVASGYVQLQATLTDSTPQDERISLIERTLRGLREI